MTKHLVTICVLFTCLSSARADSIPEIDNWNPQTLTLLSQALVSEAGWHSTTDHAAILWVLYRQWQSRRQIDPSWTLVDQVYAYCTGFKSNLWKTHKRHRWVKTLPANGVDQPRNWPSGLSWLSYKDKWSQILELTQSWYEGNIQDPCQGKAMHWAAPYVRTAVRYKLKPVKCGNTRNLFWRANNLKRSVSKG